MRFTYKSGERPLPGYTLKRGVGQGGFGEVYFAVSDSGKEVALKLLRGSTDIELRGVANCLNLKHPNLVHIYDLKTDAHADKWLVMEYVLGESLAQVIDRHPAGLPVPLAADWFNSLSRAVGYLHDHGVVHRDLKPANVFIEHGSLKVGDYGLCKSMSATHRPQTRTVGTVHYMAPEIASGNYTKSIDIYACGVMLHEMLTGKLIFDGESDGEILMKHLTGTPDVSAAPEAFRPVLTKALDKNPLKRFGSMAEFARAVEAVAASKAPAAAPVPVPPPLPVESPKPAEAPAAAPVPPATPIAVPVLARAVKAEPKPEPKPTGTARDHLADLTGALVKAPLVAAVGVVPWAVATGSYEMAGVGKMFLLTLAVSWAILLAAGRAGYKAADTWGRRGRLAALGLLIGGLSFYLDGWPVPSGEAVDDPAAAQLESHFGGLVELPPGAGRSLALSAAFFACVLGAGRWWRAAARDRKERFSLFPPFAAAFWAGVLMFLWLPAGNALAFGLVPPVLAAVTVQWVSAWTPPPPPMPKRLRWQTA